MRHIRRKTPKRRFVDTFRFPPIQKAQRLPLPEADWSVNPEMYRRRIPT